MLGTTWYYLRYRYYPRSVLRSTSAHKGLQVFSFGKGGQKGAFKVLPEAGLSFFFFFFWNLVLWPNFERSANPTFWCDPELIYDPLISVEERIWQIIRRAMTFQYQSFLRNPQWFPFLPKSKHVYLEHSFSIQYYHQGGKIGSWQREER